MAKRKGKKKEKIPRKTKLVGMQPSACVQRDNS